MIEFKAKFLKAVLPFRATNDPRYYLAGIHVEPHPDGGALIVATNGHMMMCAYDAHAVCTAPALLAVAGDAARFCLSAKGDSPDAVVHVNPITERLIITGGRDGGELYVQPGKCLLPTGAHRFPDWRRVAPKFEDLQPGFTDSIQAAYMEQAGKAHPLRNTRQLTAPSIRTWQVKATDIVVIEFDGAAEYMPLIMPIRSREAGGSMRTTWTKALPARNQAEQGAPATTEGSTA